MAEKPLQLSIGSLLEKYPLFVEAPAHPYTKLSRDSSGGKNYRKTSRDEESKESVEQEVEECSWSQATVSFTSEQGERSVLPGVDLELKDNVLLLSIPERYPRENLPRPILQLLFKAEAEECIPQTLIGQTPLHLLSKIDIDGLSFDDYQRIVIELLDPSSIDSKKGTKEFQKLVQLLRLSNHYSRSNQAAKSLLITYLDINSQNELIRREQGRAYLRFFMAQYDSLLQQELKKAAVVKKSTGPAAMFAAVLSRWKPQLLSASQSNNWLLAKIESNVLSLISALKSDDSSRLEEICNASQALLDRLDDLNGNLEVSVRSVRINLASLKDAKTKQLRADNTNLQDKKKSLQSTLEEINKRIELLMLFVDVNKIEGVDVKKLGESHTLISHVVTELKLDNPNLEEVDKKLNDSSKLLASFVNGSGVKALSADVNFEALLGAEWARNFSKKDCHKANKQARGFSRVELARNDESMDREVERGRRLHLLTRMAAVADSLTEAEWDEIVRMCRESSHFARIILMDETLREKAFRHFPFTSLDNARNFVNPLLQILLDNPSVIDSLRTKELIKIYGINDICALLNFVARNGRHTEYEVADVKPFIHLATKLLDSDVFKSFHADSTRLELDFLYLDLYKSAIRSKISTSINRYLYLGKDYIYMSVMEYLNSVDMTLSRNTQFDENELQEYLAFLLRTATEIFYHLNENQQSDFKNKVAVTLTKLILNTHSGNEVALSFLEDASQHAKPQFEAFVKKELPELALYFASLIETKLIQKNTWMFSFFGRLYANTSELSTYKKILELVTNGGIWREFTVDQRKQISQVIKRLQQLDPSIKSPASIAVDPITVGLADNFISRVIEDMTFEQQQITFGRHIHGQRLSFLLNTNIENTEPRKALLQLIRDIVVRNRSKRDVNDISSIYANKIIELLNSPDFTIVRTELFSHTADEPITLEGLHSTLFDNSCLDSGPLQLGV